MNGCTTCNQSVRLRMHIKTNPIVFISHIIRDENFQRIREISRILSHQDRSCESSRSVEIFLDQYRGVGVFIPHDKFIRIGLFRSVNRPFVVSESRAT